MISRIRKRPRTALILTLFILACYLLYRQLDRVVFLGAWLGAGQATRINLPDGFQANVFALDLNGPRFMAVGADGHLYVADRGNNRIVVLPDDDGDGKADAVRVFADELDRPHSLAYHQDAWYVAVPSGVIRLRDRDGDGVADERQTVIGDIPSGGNHTSRTIAFLPDGRMLLSVGSSCNACANDDPRRAAILVYEDATGTGQRLYATGLRNAVGLAIHPQTGVLWVSNNGRDLMGDDLPPETLYQVVEEGEYGWPACHSGRIIDPDLGFTGACDGVQQPVVEMQAHSAPLGLTFYDGDTFPLSYKGDLFIAFHGSWNRSIPTGYKVVRLDFADDQPGDHVVDFATGWIDPGSEEVAGRPVGLVVGSDSALYVSDDRAGVIYRIQYRDGG